MKLILVADIHLLQILKNLSKRINFMIIYTTKNVSSDLIDNDKIYHLLILILLLLHLLKLPIILK